MAQGFDPKEKRDADQQTLRAITEHTFKNLVTAWFELKEDSVTTAYAEDIWRSLTMHVFPFWVPPQSQQSRLQRS